METRRARLGLGTIVEIRARGPDPSIALAIDAAFAAVACVHARMSYHCAASDVSRVNREAHRRPIAVHPWTWEVLALAARVSRESDGAFDITVAPWLVRWRLLPRTVERSGGTFRDIRLNGDGTVSFARPLAIDLGGIAKGFAVDRAADALERHGIRDYVVNAGGDLRVGHTLEPIHVRHPDASRGFLPLASVARAAVATSARTADEHRVQGAHVHPIVAPRERAPADYRGSVSVIADTCALADALTKVVAINARLARPVLARFDAEMIAIPSLNRHRRSRAIA